MHASRGSQRAVPESTVSASVGTKDKEWPPKGASEREKKANVEFGERRFEKIKRIDEKRRE